MSSNCHSVEKWKIYSHRNFFRQINYKVISLVKPLLWQNFCQKCVRVNFRNFHTVSVEKRKTHCHTKNVAVKFWIFSTVQCGPVSVSWVNKIEIQSFEKIREINFSQINYEVYVCSSQCGKRGYFTITIFAQKLEKLSWNRSKCKIGSIYLVKTL